MLLARRVMKLNADGKSKQADLRSCKGTMEKNIKIQKWEEGEKYMKK